MLAILQFHFELKPYVETPTFSVNNLRFGGHCRFSDSSASSGLTGLDRKRAVVRC